RRLYLHALQESAASGVLGDREKLALREDQLAGIRQHQGGVRVPERHGARGATVALPQPRPILAVPGKDDARTRLGEMSRHGMACAKADVFHQSRAAGSAVAFPSLD